MSVLGAFLTTWGKARSAFGDGTPQSGTPYLDSGNAVTELESGMESTMPGSLWSGTASDAYGAANVKHRQNIREFAVLDQRLGTQIDRSAAVITAGRQDLDAVRSWVVDAASLVPQSAAGEKMLVPIVAKGIGQVSEIIQQSNLEIGGIADEIRRLTGEYQALGGPHGKESPAPDPESEEEKKRAEEERRKKLDEILGEYQVGEDPGGTHEIDFPAWADKIVGEEIATQELTATEIAMLLSNPHYIKSVFDIKEQARAEANKRFPPPSGREIDNQNDAFRHAYANALMTQKFGEEWTRRFTTAHEGRDDNYASSEAMDLYNNEIGRRIAAEHPNAATDELAGLVSQAVLDGETVVIRPDGVGLEWSNNIAPAVTGDSSKSAPVDGKPQTSPYPLGGG